tara:strand:+ start:4881 stop:5315 length:435 start_codon:yes stop_codon:yes gene_type:complete
MITRISLKASDLAEVHRLVASNQKIKAIKLVRNSGRLLSDDSTIPADVVGLREAKLAIDNLCGSAPAAHRLVADWHVHSLTVSGPAGEKVELDLENLQMHFLTTLTSVGLDEVNRLLGLVEFIKKWQGDVPPSIASDSTEEEVK